MHAPKQKKIVKELLQYIAGYIRRSVIALGRIEEYGGEYVTFKYVDKNKWEREAINTLRRSIYRTISASYTE